MIRKDILPNTWGDEWKVPADTTPQLLSVPQGASLCVVITDDPWIVEMLDGKAVCMPSTPLLKVDAAEDSSLQLYRLQGMNTPSEHITTTQVAMQQGAQLRMNTITLGGGHVRNNIEIRMHGEHCHVEADGLYLIDREQQCDNYIFVEHAKPNCYSRELYKGIVDDSARARFNGHVLVQDGATKTEAFQTNRNILLTDKAHVDTRPFLEIYNDDVKCSHGYAELRLLRRSDTRHRAGRVARHSGRHGEEAAARRVGALVRRMRHTLHHALQWRERQFQDRPQ